MKLITSFDHYNKEHKSVILENMDDLMVYVPLNAKIKAKQAIGFWVGFKNQPSNFVRSPLSYAQHEGDHGGMSNLMAHHLTYNEKSPVSLVDFCNTSDSFINDIHVQMYKYISEGKVICVNYKGGYCGWNSIEELNPKSVIDINDKQLHNYLLQKEIFGEFKITSSTVVIENDNYIPDTVITSFCNLTNINRKDLQIIQGFKTKTLLFENQDWIKFFRDGIKDYGLQNIVFETTAQDGGQILGLKSLLENLNVPLNIYIKLYGDDKSIFKTDNKNINVIFL